MWSAGARSPAEAADTQASTEKDSDSLGKFWCCRSCLSRDAASATTSGAASGAAEGGPERLEEERLSAGEMAAIRSLAIVPIVPMKPSRGEGAPSSAAAAPSWAGGVAGGSGGGSAKGVDEEAPC